MAVQAAQRISNGRMDVAAARQFLLDHFQAHAIKGDLKPGRTYEVVDPDPAHLKFRTRNHSGRYVQTLFADLVTCKSLNYGEFRRVDLFWGVNRNEQEEGRASASNERAPSDDPVIHSIPPNEFYPNGEPVPVDAFMDRGLDGRFSGRFRKEKSA